MAGSLPPEDDEDYEMDDDFDDVRYALLVKVENID